ncbi:MAG TPA: alpha/beta fold hydrolase, partial [Burkholderiaceae bacterium]|nr:alpha/beta fold hydrolase [Burkholderiaceae bacterium]
VIVGAIVDPRSPRTSLLYVLRVWAWETWTSLRAFSWRQPFAAGFPELAVTRDPDRPAVLLIHGYVCNRAAWARLLASNELAGCNVATVNLEPAFASIDAYADVVHGAVETLRAASGAAQVTLVCHSMGGLAARAYLRKYGDGAVIKIVTICTPHHGTVFGLLGHGRNAREMARGSAFLRDLAASESAALRSKFVCIASRDDNLIVPRSSPILPGAKAVWLEGTGHLAMIEDPRVWAVVRQEVFERTAAEKPAPALTA